MRLRNSLALLLASSLLASSCGKKSDDNDTPTDEAKGMPGTLSLGCGASANSNCFETGVTALTGPNLANDQGQLETMLMFSWLVVGFPNSRSAYYDQNIGAGGALAKKTVPREGMVSRIEGTRKEIVEAASAQISKCSDAPSTGSFTSANGMVLNWATPSFPIPGDHPKAANAKYDKAVTAAWTDSEDSTFTYKGRFEFVCDYNAMAMMVETSVSGVVKNRIVFFYDRETQSKLYADMYLSDSSGKFSSDPLWLAFQMRGTDDSKFKAWTNRVGTNGTGKALGYRYAINADYTKPSVSFYTVEAGTGSDQSWTEAQFLAHATVTDSSVTTTNVPSATSGNDPKQGCADSWMKKGQDITSATLCPDLSLTEAPPFFWDATMKNSMANMYTYGKTKIEAL